MEEYIEKRYLVEEFIERAEAWEDVAKIDNNLEYKGIARAYKNACTIIELMPPTNVTEAKYGKWILVKGIFPSDNNYKCSNCGTIFETDFKFCPNCGADMRCKIK